MTTPASTKKPDPPRVAIACQGGGSHTAFTAGALKSIVARADAQGFRITALSGTSGGAICALLAWHGLVRQAAGSWTSVETRALLDAFWHDNSALLPGERAWNDWIVGAIQLQGRGLLPELRSSPYSLQGTLFASLLESAAPRREFVDLEALLRKHVDADAIRQPVDEPRLLMGAVEVLSGAFTAFDSRQTGEQGISIEAALASATLPFVFPAVRIGSGCYWDGLYSQNPPIRQFLAGLGAGQKPDEIWLIRINPQVQAELPRSAEAIEDRRNELAGNLSLNQELDFIAAVNRWLADGSLVAEDKKPIVVRELTLSPGLSERLGYASKLNRDPQFIADLISDGERQADAFLAAR